MKRWVVLASVAVSVMLLTTCGDDGSIDWSKAPKQGPAGKDGRDGVDGRDGKEGPKGDAGIPGTDGKDGVDGRDGVDGTAGPHGPQGPEGAKGDKGDTGPAGRDGDSCTLVEGRFSDGRSGALVTCGDTSVFIFNGKDGADGKDGAAGPQGLPGVDGQDGTPGQDGAVGPVGPQGPRGEAGAAGSPGADASPVSIIDPCGDAPNIWDEVILQFPDGTLVSSFSDDASGKNTRFSVLTDGLYMTTDGSHCVFSVRDGKVE